MRPLVAATRDARDMATLAASEGFEATLLLDHEATRHAVIDQIQRSAGELGSDDFFLISFSCLGTRLFDLNHRAPTSCEAAWCLFDGELIEDELAALWALFADGLRILVISDTCHGAAREADSAWRSRALPLETSLRTYAYHRSRYSQLPLRRRDRPPLASIRLLAACREFEQAREDDRNGRFTAALIQTWASGQFTGNYDRFHRELTRRADAAQCPTHQTLGAPSADYDFQKPFHINAERAAISGSS